MPTSQPATVLRLSAEVIAAPPPGPPCTDFSIPPLLALAYTAVGGECDCLSGPVFLAKDGDTCLWKGSRQCGDVEIEFEILFQSGSGGERCAISGYVDNVPIMGLGNLTADPLVVSDGAFVSAVFPIGETIVIVAEDCELGSGDTFTITVST